MALEEAIDRVLINKGSELWRLSNRLEAVGEKLGLKKRIYDRRRYAENIDKERERSKNRYWANPEKESERRKRSYRNDPERRKKIRLKHLRETYGLTEVEWGEKFEAQGHCCAICKAIEPNGSNWHTDHCHRTGQVRGILCQPCNHTVRNHTPERLREAADYVESWLNLYLN